jgi:hypothetical protein
VAEEQVFEAIIPVVPIALAPQRGLVWWYIGAALAIASSSTSAELTAGVGEKTSLTTGETTTGFCKSRGNSAGIASTGTDTGNSKRGCNFENISERSWFSLL